MLQQLNAAQDVTSNYNPKNWAKPEQLVVSKQNEFWDWQRKISHVRAIEKKEMAEQVNQERVNVSHEVVGKDHK